MTRSEMTPKLHAGKDRGTILSTVWAALLFSFIYADIFGLYFGPEAESNKMSSGAILFFAVIMETAIAMVVLARVLPYAWNRWTNIGLAVLHIAVLVFSLTGGAVTSFYAFFAALEITTLLFVIGYAWTWRRQPQSDRVGDRDALAVAGERAR